MKKLILIVAAIMVAFAVLLPFASKTPDGLQTMVANSADQQQQQQPVWNGLMGNYSVALANPYVSMLIAGLFGTGIVLTAGFALGSSVTQKKKRQTAKKI